MLHLERLKDAQLRIGNGCSSADDDRVSSGLCRVRSTVLRRERLPPSLEFGEFVLLTRIPSLYALSPPAACRPRRPSPHPRPLPPPLGLPRAPPASGSQSRQSPGLLGCQCGWRLVWCSTPRAPDTTGAAHQHCRKTIGSGAAQHNPQLIGGEGRQQAGAASKPHAATNGQQTHTLRTGVVADDGGYLAQHTHSASPQLLQNETAKPLVSHQRCRR